MNDSPQEFATVTNSLVMVWSDPVLWWSNSLRNKVAEGRAEELQSLTRSIAPLLQWSLSGHRCTKGL